jgi:hypothetical protein
MTANRTVTANFTSNQQPDLIVQSITASPPHPAPNQAVTFTIRIKNQGSANVSSNFYIDFYIDDQPITDCTDIGTTWWATNSLAAGEARDLTYDFSGFGESGAHTLYAFADTNCNISESNENNNILGPITLNVQDKAFEPISQWNTGFGSNHGWQVDKHPRMLADVNGDGRQDAVGFFDDGVWVGLSNGSGFNTMTKWTTGFSYNQGWRTDQHPRMLGDVNGDGRADIVGFGYEGAWIALSNGSSFGSASKWTANFNYNQGWRVNQHPRTVADVNGDGKDDLIGFGYEGVWITLSTGSGFGPISKWTSNFNYNQGWRVEQHPRMAADVNGDGKDDLIGFGYTGVWITLSTGSGFGPTSMWTSDFNYSIQGWRVEQHPRTAADVNGDGKADLIGFGYYGVWIGLSNGSGFDPIQMMTEDFNYSIQGWRVEKHPRMAGDVNDDGKADLIGFGNYGVWVATAR